MKMIGKMRFIGLFILLVFQVLANGQTIDSTAFSLVDKAFSQHMESGNLYVKYKAIGYGLKKPAAIFDYPAGKLHELKGYMMINKNQCELDLVQFKLLSDGKLTVMVNNIDAFMYIDSVRLTGGAATVENFNRMFSQLDDPTALQFAGDENMKGVKYKVVEVSYKENKERKTLYYVNAATSQLTLMAELNKPNDYDVYWVEWIGKAPETHDYTIRLPKRLLENYYGYTVIDNRFINYHKN